MISSRVLRSSGFIAGAAACVLLQRKYGKERSSFFSVSAEQLRPNLDLQKFKTARTKWDNNWDHCEDKEGGDPNSAPRATRHLLLIRHGQYHTEKKRDEERVLTELGRIQAEETGKRLAELNFPYTKIIQSNMTRAMETAKLISKSIPQVSMEAPDSILREGGPIKPEPSGRWHSEEEYFADGARIEAAFRKYFHRASSSQEKDSYEVVVCHANVIRYFVCRALQLPPEAWLRMTLKNASITWISIPPDGRVNLRTLGDAGHFSPEKLTIS